jgi:hypothetical protein
VDDDGFFIAGAWGPVPASLPQSPQAAEFSSLAVAAMLIKGAATVGCDCMNVVKAWQRGAGAADELKSTYSGLTRETRKAEGACLIDEVYWVKGHQTITRNLLKGQNQAKARQRQHRC